MDRNAILRWVLIAAGVLVFWKFILPMFTGKSKAEQTLPPETYVSAPHYAPDIVDPVAPGQAAPPPPPEGELCTIQGNRFHAELSSRGASLRHFFLTDERYAHSEARDVASTFSQERWRSLRTLFRGEGATDQVKYDRFPWQLEKQGDRACRFTYDNEEVRIVKTVKAGDRPFELVVETELTNLASAPRKHRMSIEAFAYRKNAEIKGNLGRVSPFQSELSCAAGKEVIRKSKDDFNDGWSTTNGVDRYAAVSNYYFAQALVPMDGDRPDCALLAEDWFSEGQARDDDEAGAVYHARLVYPVKELAAKQTAKYRQVAYFGPKERGALAHVGGRDLGDLINLGFFSPVAKVLVGVLLFFHDKITFGNWGLAIILMTVGVRVLLFPLSWKQIKITIGMRKLKPEVDGINAKFAGDMQAKNLAMMELYRKHGVNPLGGCLPSLAQMPVWFAMYTTLQTAVEMYQVKFLWFSDLSAPDRFYVLPIVLGVFMIVQQRIMPQQGMDPVQQKMMMYLLPAVFTVMMLFLPAALGIYMLTNSVLGIAQQLIVERIAPRAGGPGGAPKSEKESRTALSASLGKGKARV